MRKVLLLLLTVWMLPQLQAQDENLVPNPGFENADTKRLKNAGEMDLYIQDWFSSTKAPADLLSTGMKSPKVNLPENIYGVQSARGGDNCIGFRAYTKDKKTTRTYVSVKLDKKLEKNQQYCMKFNISLGDLSKYSVSDIGMYVSDRKVIQPNTGAMVKAAQIKHKTNKVMNVMDGWETICGTFIGTGQEEYIIIGCFESDATITIAKNKKPKGVLGTIRYEAYYYLDDVEVMAIEAKSQCICSKEDEQAPDLIYSKSVVVGEDWGPSDHLKNSTVYYAFLKSNVNAIGKRDLAGMVKILNDNPSLKIEIIGHSDNDEVDEARINARYKEIARKRAQNIADYLVAQGVNTSRLTVSSADNSNPANTRPTPLSKAQNRRVQFVVK
ncbi:MAG: outer membrane protein OmpA-like peptidoglycan-associated protein [Flavobacteriales bacterium]|jgi:outer membrane protein OmpA-like peptidoglycan-associated protein